METQFHNLSPELHQQPAEQCATTQNQQPLAQDSLTLQEPTSSLIQHQAASTPSSTKTSNGTDPAFEPKPTAHAPLSVKITEKADLHRSSSVRHLESEATSPPELSKILPKRASISFKDNKIIRKPVGSLPSRFSRSQDPRLPFFLGRHSSVTDGRLPSPLLLRSSRSSFDSQLAISDQTNRPRIFIGTSTDTSGLGYKKQAVLVPRQIQRPGNVIMTSSENSVYGSAASSITTSSYVDTQTHQPIPNEGVVEGVETGASSSENMESTLVADDATSNIDAGTIDGQRNGTPTPSPTLNNPSPNRASRSSSMAATISTRPEAAEGGKEQGTLAWCKKKILSCCCCDHGDEEA